MLQVEIVTMILSVFVSLLFAYMYEIWSRKKVLSISFILLAIGVLISAFDLAEDDNVMHLSRIATSVIAGTIMQNPLLNDYVKKHNRGMAASFQTLGSETGEIIAFYIIYKGLLTDKDNQEIIFYTMTAVVAVFGLITVCFLVKDKKIERNYVKDAQGNVQRHKSKI